MVGWVDGGMMRLKGRMWERKGGRRGEEKKSGEDDLGEEKM